MNGRDAPRAIRLLSCLFAASLTIGFGGAAGSQAPKRDSWTREGGPARAGAVVAKCLEAAPDTHYGRRTCVLAAFEACEDEHGTSQRDLNDCASFSRAAWESRHSAARSRLLGATMVDIRFGSPDKVIVQLAESERRWDAWNGLDCEMQAALSKGGSIHRYELDICLSNHAAHRAIELESLIEGWGKIFKL